MTVRARPAAAVTLTAIARRDGRVDRDPHGGLVGHAAFVGDGVGELVGADEAGLWEVAELALGHGRRAVRRRGNGDRAGAIAVDGDVDPRLVGRRGGDRLAHRRRGEDLDRRLGGVRCAAFVGDRVRELVAAGVARRPACSAGRRRRPSRCRGAVGRGDRGGTGARAVRVDGDRGLERRRAGDVLADLRGVENLDRRRAAAGREAG